MQGAVGEVGRAAERNAHAAVGRDLFAQQAAQPRLADARLSLEHHHLAEPVLALSPALGQELDLGASPHNRRRGARGRHTGPVPGFAHAENAERDDGLGTPLQFQRPGLLENKCVFDQPPRRGGDEQRIRRGQRLEFGRDIRSLPKCEGLATVSAADFAHDHRAGMNPDPERKTFASLKVRPVQLLHRLQDAEAGADRALGIVFVRPGIAEVHEQSVAEILGDETVETVDHRRGFLLIPAQNIVQVFGVELRGKLGRADEIAEHHRELAALRAGHRHRSPCLGRRDGIAMRFALFDGRLAALPDEHLAVVIERKPQYLDQLGLQVLDICVVNLELALERAIRHPLLAPQQCDRLVQTLLEGHAGHRRSPSIPALSPLTHTGG